MILSDLDDFILPSQVCVNPLVGTTAPSAPTAGSAVRIDLDSSDLTSLAYETDATPLPGVGVIRTQAKDDVKIATISLSDCLACSGCVTSAEEVLIQEQSYAKLQQILREGRSSVAITLSPQSVASIAHSIGLSQLDAFVAIASMLKSLGVRYVLDASAGGDVALVESGHEFLRRYNSGRKSDWATPPLSMAVSSSRVSRFNADDSSSVVEAVTPEELQSASVHLPMLCSHCPGWVCYAEKTCPQALPYIDTTKSAQQIIGSIIKHPLCAKHLETAGRQLYHAAVMPCFDKKLEATRKDFFHDDTGVNEVDLVISTAELVNFLVDEMKAILGEPSTENAERASASERLAATIQRFKSSPSCRLDPIGGASAFEALFRSASADGSTLVAAADSNSGSGGYMEFMFRFAHEKLNGLDIWDSPLEYQAGRNEDIAELTCSLVGEGGHKLLFAKAYGFRNIQSVVMKMKTKRCKYDFVEIMACPKGCVNGGGQSKAADRETPLETRDRVAGVIEKMSAVSRRRPEDSPLVQWLYGSEALNAQPCSLPAAALLHTRYHAIPKLEQIAPLVAKW